MVFNSYIIVFPLLLWKSIWIAFRFFKPLITSFNISAVFLHRYVVSREKSCSSCMNWPYIEVIEHSPLLRWIIECGLNKTLDKVMVSEQKVLEIIFYFIFIYFNLIYLILKTQNRNSTESKKYHIDDCHLNRRQKSKTSRILNFFPFYRMMPFSNHRYLWFNFSLCSIHPIL